jgi:tetratricopeptide (TPR) repeat protein
VVGVDINENCRQHAGGRRIVEIGSQADPNFLDALGKKYRPQVIIDDGSHKTDHMILSYQKLWPYLAAGGIYIVEDVSAQAGKHSASLQGTSYPTALDYFQRLSYVVSCPAAQVDFDRRFASNVDGIEYFYGAIALHKTVEPEQDPIARRRRMVEAVNLPELWGRFAVYILGHGGDPAEAVECAKRAVALNPKEAMHHYQLSLALEKAGDFDGALSSARASACLCATVPMLVARVADLEAKRGAANQPILSNVFRS